MFDIDNKWVALYIKEFLRGKQYNNPSFAAHVLGVESWPEVGGQCDFDFVDGNGSPRHTVYITDRAKFVAYCTAKFGQEFVLRLLLEEEKT